MRLGFALLALATMTSARAGEGAWVAFFREGNNSSAFERASITGTSVNVLSVSPKKTTGTVVYAWDIKTQVHQFDCAKNTYRLATRKYFDEQGKLLSDETNVVVAMNDAFKDRAFPLDTETLRKAHALVCAKSDPAPAKPFPSMAEALAWMAN